MYDYLNSKNMEINHGGYNEIERILLTLKLAMPIMLVDLPDVTKNGKYL